MDLLQADCRLLKAASTQQGANNGRYNTCHTEVATNFIDAVPRETITKMEPVSQATSNEANQHQATNITESVIMQKQPAAEWSNKVLHRAPGRTIYSNVLESRDMRSRNDVRARSHWCKPCHQAFSDSEIKNHLLTHFKGKHIDCAQCVEGFLTEALMEDHVFKHMGLTINKLQSVGITIKHFEVQFKESLPPGGIPAHLLPPPKPPRQCRSCGEKLESWQIGKHRQEHQQESPYKCGMCAIYFKTQEKLSKHETELCDKLRHKCGSCGQVFRRLETLKKHELVHVQKHYICDKCGNQYQAQNRLDRHMYRHTGLWPYKCSQCGNGYSSNSGLIRHMEIHSDFPSHICQTCGKGFFTRNNLRLHQVVHKEDRPYKCSICGKTSKCSRSAKRHELLHTAQRTHECTTCRLGFKNKAGLKMHMRTHGGERDHKCDKCGKLFFTNDEVIRHMLTHTQERPHKCEVCGNRFQQKGHLVTHMMRHTGEWSHKCGLGGKGFGNPGHLAKHMANKHTS